MKPLPSGWGEATVGDVAEYINGLAFKPSDWGDEGRPIIRIQNLTSSDARFNRTTRTVDDRFLVRGGDLLVSWSATLDAFVWRGPEAVLNQHIFKVVPNNDLVEPDFLYWAMKEVIKEMIQSEHLHGSTMKHINRGPFLSHPLKLPPKSEQKRIVAKIEELTARSRRAKEALDAVPPLLDQLRQSILAAAFRGDLTADWRAKHPNVEPGDRLLVHIRAERRSWWEQDYTSRARARGREADSDEWRGKYQPHQEFHGVHPGQVPANWSWAYLGECIVDSLYGPRFPGSSYGAHGVPTIRTTDMNRHGEVVLNDPPRVAVTAQQLAELGLEQDDLLVTRTGATIGKCALFASSTGPALPSAYLIRFRLTRTSLLPRYALFFLLSPRGQAGLIGGATATAQPNVNARTILAIPVPLAPHAEQEEIVRRLEVAFAALDKAKRQVEDGREHLQTLDSSILSKAFLGALVPQQPTDEPASVLLDRVRAERAGEASIRQARGQGRKTEKVEGSDRGPTTPAPQRRGRDIGALDENAIHDEVFAALWPRGPLDRDAAVRLVAEHLREAGYVDFQRLRSGGPVYAQCLEYIESAVKAGRLDRPRRGQVRACKSDATKLSPEDWRHVLVVTLDTSPTDREEAIRVAAEWARGHLGVEFSRLRSGSHIVEGLRSAINSAIRRGEVVRHDAARISRAVAPDAS